MEMEMESSTVLIWNCKCKWKVRKAKKEAGKQAGKQANRQGNWEKRVNEGEEKKKKGLKRIGRQRERVDLLLQGM